ncbi:MAG: hypothetical protein KKB62_03575 [Nanoarchaeota archaeon]|nr:hypothetical protein [Nanoarchaeota archaeon]
MTKEIEVKSKYVLPSTGYYEFSANGVPKYRLLEKMTPSMTQDELAELYEVEKKKGNPLPLNSIQMFEIMEDAVKSGDKNLMNHIQKGLQMWPNTLSRVIYNPKGEDEVIHWYGTSDEEKMKGHLVGKDGFIKNINNPNALEFLLGTSDIKRINGVTNSINKTPMYFWRFNSKPNERTERVVGFDAGGGRLYLDADRCLSGEIPAFLVEFLK